MKQVNWPPLVAGTLILMLLSFLYFQTQRVDSLNEEQSDVLNQLQHLQQRLELYGDVATRLSQIDAQRYPTGCPRVDLVIRHEKVHHAFGADCYLFISAQQYATEAHVLRDAG